MNSTIVSPHIIDVTDQTFATEVIEKSKTMPVVVDFWAAWCGPCRMLGPILERLTGEFDGVFILAKVDVDQSQMVARQFQVQGIPAVKAFVDGKVVGEFTGAQPEPQVRQFLQQLIPSEADGLARQAFEWERSGQLMMAEANYRAALEADSNHYPAMVGLGRVLMMHEKIEEGIEMLNQIPADAPERNAAEALLASANFLTTSAGHNEADLRAQLEREPDNIELRYTLANLLASQTRYLEAMDEFLEVIRRDRRYHDDAPRKAMLALLAIIGEQDDVTRTYRRKLANLLF